jgi:endonuclease III
VSFYRNKARHVKAACEQILERFGGRVPSTMEELLTLPGVGRKTANLVLILAHRSETNICVDTHVHRISNRLGWVRRGHPSRPNRRSTRRARRWWPLVNLYLVTWGQNVCRPVYPLCPACVLADSCPKVGVTKVGRPRSM